MLLYLISALLQNGQAHAQHAPPFAPPAPPAPPAPTSMIYPGGRANAQWPQGVERFTVDVEVSAGTEVLWKGSLRLSSGQPASFRREVSEAPAAQCEAGAYGTRPDQSSVNLTMVPSRWSGRENSVDVKLRWGRPTPDACATPGSSVRTVELNQSVQLQPGQWVTVSGDAGLVLKIRRR